MVVHNVCLFFSRYYNKVLAAARAFGKCFHIQIKKASAKKREEEGLLLRLEALLEKKSDLFDTLSMHGFDNIACFLGAFLSKNALRNFERGSKRILNEMNKKC